MVPKIWEVYADKRNVKEDTNIAVATALLLAGCAAGGLPSSSGDDAAQYDVVTGMKDVAQTADTSRIWLPLHYDTW